MNLPTRRRVQKLPAKLILKHKRNAIKTNPVHEAEKFHLFLKTVPAAMRLTAIRLMLPSLTKKAPDQVAKYLAEIAQELPNFQERSKLVKYYFSVLATAAPLEMSHSIAALYKKHSFNGLVREVVTEPFIQSLAENIRNLPGEYSAKKNALSTLEELEFQLRPPETDRVRMARGRAFNLI